MQAMLQTLAPEMVATAETTVMVETAKEIG
jgi:hypothetical protein